MTGSKASSQRACRILALDDEAPLLRSLAEELGELFPQAELMLCSSCSEAASQLDKLAKRGAELDFAFLDIRLPDGLGTDIARLVREVYPKASVLFTTAYGEYALEAFDIHVTGYLMKPVSARGIVEVLDDMLPQWREGGELSLPAGYEPPLPSARVRVVQGAQPQVFIDGELILFSRRKSLELLGFLVRRQGEPASTEQLAAALWPEEPYGRKVKNKVTVAISGLRTVLREHGCEDLLVKGWNSLSLDMSKLTAE